MSAIGFQRTLLALARTANHSAADVLIAAIDGTSQVVRRKAIAAFARRTDEVSQRKFLTAFQQFSTDEIQALGDVTKHLRPTLRRALADHNIESTQAACHVIFSCRAFDEFPALVTAAIDPHHPGADAVAATTLELALALHEQIVEYRRAPAGRDPSFARRWALTALSRAVDRFREHRRVELLEAFLLITTPGNHRLTHLLTDQTHPGHEPLLAMLRTSPSVGAIEVLAKLFDDTQTPLALLEIAAGRTDAHFRKLFLQTIGQPPSPRVLENAQRIKRLSLLEKPSDDWFVLPAEHQATAVQMVMAARFSRRTKVQILDEILDRGSSKARLVACAALGQIALPEAIVRLEELLDDKDHRIVAVAAKSLRLKGYAGAVDRLAELLSHHDQFVRNVARTGLRDFTFVRYVGQFDQLDEQSRRVLGRIVRESDPTALEELKREISAAALPRKLQGLQMAGAMNAVDEVIDLVIMQAEHQDAAVRSDAVVTLAAGTTNEAREAIEAATGDTNAIVRNRASRSLQQFLDKKTAETGHPL